MKLPVCVVALLAAVVMSPGAAAATPTSTATDLQAEFRAYSGAELVFRSRDLPKGAYYDVMRELSSARRIAAARIAIREVKKYPKGYLGKMGLRAIGVFDGLASKRGDGYRAYDRALGGYRYYGLWNGDDALVAAYYSDGQLPLTIHHEIFHHVDATHAGRTRYARYFTADDERWDKALRGVKRYRALTLSRADRAALKKRAQGSILRTTVSGYAAKSAGEDQAETARYLMTSLPDALLQMADQPRLAGSQRMLHVLHQYPAAGPRGAKAANAAWMIDVALGRAGQHAQVRAAAAAAVAKMRARIEPRRGDSTFRVWGGEDASGVNFVLRYDLNRFGRRIEAVHSLARGVSGAGPTLSQASLRSLRLLARYRGYIAHRWSITSGTEASFRGARDRMTHGVSGRALRARLTSASWRTLARSIDSRGRLSGELLAPAKPRVSLPPNRYSKKVDAAISDLSTRRAIRRVQPAAVRLSNGSGVNLTADGWILTAGHVAPKVGQRRSILFPDGRSFTARIVAYSRKLDISILKIDGRNDLPTAALRSTAPTVGTVAIAIGQPGRSTPSGEATGYKPFHVSVGKIRGFRPDRLGAQSLGRTKHDAWTYWGHSGAPIFDASGRIIAMHNSWDSTTAMRHAVTWEALVSFLRQHRVPFRQQ